MAFQTGLVSITLSHLSVLRDVAKVSSAPNLSQAQTPFVLLPPKLQKTCTTRSNPIAHHVWDKRLLQRSPQVPSHLTSPTT